MQGTKRQEHKYANNDETRSQYSIGRRSVGTANTARSVLVLEKTLNKIYQELGEDANHEDTAAVLFEAGLANYEEGNFSKAPDHLTLALNMYRNLQADSVEEEAYESEIAEILKTLGMVYLARKEWEKASNNFEQAFTKKQKIYGAHVINTDIAELVRYLGLSHMGQGPEHQTIAIKHLTTALVRFKRIYGEDTDHFEIADTYYHLGCAYQLQNEHDQARAQFTSAVAMFRELAVESNQTKIAETYYKIAFTYLAVSNYGKAIGSFTKALETYTAMYEGKPAIDPNYVDLLFHLGKTYFTVGEYGLAKTHISNAWLKYQALFGDTYPNHPSILAARTALTEVEEKIAEKNKVAIETDQDSVDAIQKHATDAKPNSTLSTTSAKPPHSDARTLESTSKPPSAINLTGQKPTPVSVSSQGIFAPVGSNPKTNPSLRAAEPAPAPKKTHTLNDVKAYYLKKAGIFNASSKIFKTNNLDAAITELRNRAGNGGASADTLKHFGYSTN